MFWNCYYFVTIKTVATNTIRTFKPKITQKPKKIEEAENPRTCKLSFKNLDFASPVLNLMPIMYI